MQKLKIHLFSYQFQGAEYSFEIPASTIQEAKERLSRMAFATYNGEVIAKIPAIPSTGLLTRALTNVRNRFLAE